MLVKFKEQQRDQAETMREKEVSDEVLAARRPDSIWSCRPVCGPGLFLSETGNCCWVLNRSSTTWLAF